MKSLILIALILAFQPAASCQTAPQPMSDADKAQQYYVDGLACYNRLDFLCAMTLLEQVWYLDDYSKVDRLKWTYYTAHSNYLVAIDDNVLYPFDKRVQSAIRSDALFDLFVADFSDKQLLLQYFIITRIKDTCDERRIAAVDRFHEISAETDDAEFVDVKSEILALLKSDADCTDQQ